MNWTVLRAIFYLCMISGWTIMGTLFLGRGDYLFVALAIFFVALSLYRAILGRP